MLAFTVMFALVLTGSPAIADSQKLNVFERFRVEMTVDHIEAAGKFMSARALAKWNSSVMAYFDKPDRQLSHFFAVSIIIPKRKDVNFYLLYFNPWVDGALFTRWVQEDGNWKVDEFVFVSGQRLRGEVTPQSEVTQRDETPVWIRNNGTFLSNLYAYYKYMRAQIVQTPFADCLSWLTLEDRAQAAELLRIKLRMRTRVQLAILYLVRDRSGHILSNAITRLKYDALAKNRATLAGYSPHADILVDLKPEIVKTLRENWFFRHGNVFTVILSSPIAPRLFVFMNVLLNGRIEGVLMGDLESMADLVRGPVPPPPAKSEKPAREASAAPTAN